MQPLVALSWTERATHVLIELELYPCEDSSVGCFIL